LSGIPHVGPWLKQYVEGQAAAAPKEGAQLTQRAFEPNLLLEFKPSKRFRLPSGELVSAYALNDALVERYARELVDVANLLPALKWSPEQLKAKWKAFPNQHSYVFVNDGGSIIAMALGYERNEIEGAIGVPDIPRKQKHLYLGPGAIREEYRRRGLFEQLVFCILESY